MEPLQLALIAGLSSDEDVILYDDRLEKINFDEPADLVAITVDTFTARRAYQIAAEYRKRNVKVVLGGIHPSLMPKEASLYADTIVTGDVEPVWKNLLNDFKNGRLLNQYYGNLQYPQLNCFPNRSIFSKKKYLPVSLVQFSRGCAFNCSFCSVSKFYKQTHQCRKIEDVIYEIEKDKLKTILFVDDNLIANKQKIKDFLRELIPLKVKWASQTSVEMVKDKDLLKLMADSGCVGNLIGFESINVNTLQWFNKSPNLRGFNNYKEVLDILSDYGMLTWGSFMIGNDFDTMDTINKTLDFTIKNKFTLAFFHILMPYPGTDVYEQFKAQKRLLYDEHWWNHPDYKYNHAAFIPKLMTADDLTQATINVNKEFYKLSSINKRLWNTDTHLRNLINFWIYTKLNFILRNTSV